VTQINLQQPAQRDLPFHFVCPHCQVELEVTEWEATCPLCARQWPRREGILAFVSEAEEYAFLSRLKEVEMPGIEDELANAAATQGWRAALTSYYRQATTPEQRAFVSHYTLEEKRAVWKLLLPPGKEAIALDYGCGFGIYSLNLARTYRHVCAVDLTFARLNFLKQRIMQDGIANVTPIWAGDRLPLPFSEACFDLVMMNGVLEWVAVNGNTPPEQIQQAYLSEMYRILRPGGHLYIGIENRYGYGYFFGKRDEHSYLRFSTLLPRRVANAYSQLVRGKPYREYTYSAKQLVSLLHYSGFAQIQVYAPIPGYNAPRFIVNPQDRQVLRSTFADLMKPRNTKERLMKAIAPVAIKIGLLQKTLPAFMILAEK